MKRLITNLATAGMLAGILYAASAGAQPAPAAVRVNVNTATLAQLCYLPGVGQATGAAIIAGRPYKAAADLMRVRGIKAGKFGKMAPFVSVSGQTTAQSKIHVAKVSGGAK